MTVVAEPVAARPGAASPPAWSPDRTRPRLWWRTAARWASELTLLAVLYAAYARIRDSEGAEQSLHAVSTARVHGLAVRHVEQLLGLAWEPWIQRHLLELPWLMKGFDVFYATAHVCVTVGVLVLVAVFARRRYPVARNALVLATVVALAVFALYPTMPPRLIAESHLADTLGTVGGLWSFRTPAIEHIADPFAAMPSLHLIWSLWCAIAVWPLCRSAWQRRAAVAYPVLTGVVVIATGNHWILDLVAAAALVSGSWWLAARLGGRSRGAIAPI